MKRFFILNENHGLLACIFTCAFAFPNAATASCSHMNGPTAQSSERVSHFTKQLLALEQANASMETSCTNLEISTAQKMSAAATAEACKALVEMEALEKEIASQSKLCTSHFSKVHLAVANLNESHIQPQVKADVFGAALDSLLPSLQQKCGNEVKSFRKMADHSMRLADRADITLAKVKDNMQQFSKLADAADNLRKCTHDASSRCPTEQKLAYLAKLKNSPKGDGGPGKSVRLPSGGHNHNGNTITGVKKALENKAKGEAIIRSQEEKK